MLNIFYLRCAPFIGSTIKFLFLNTTIFDDDEFKRFVEENKETLDDICYIQTTTNGIDIYYRTMDPYDKLPIFIESLLRTSLGQHYLEKFKSAFEENSTQEILEAHNSENSTSTQEILESHNSENSTLYTKGCKTCVATEESLKDLTKEFKQLQRKFDDLNKITEEMRFFLNSTFLHNKSQI